MNIKKFKINNRRSLNNWQKLKEDNISYIKENWQYDIEIHYTLYCIINSLLVKYQDMKNVWLSTIAKCLKHKLNKSFKKSNRIN